MREGKKIVFFQALLYRTARNLVIDFYRKSGANVESIEESELIIADRSDLTLDEKMNLKMDFERVQHSLRQLKDSYREVLVMHYLNQLSVKEISRALDMSPGAVRVLLHRGVKALKQVMDAG